MIQAVEVKDWHRVRRQVYEKAGLSGDAIRKIEGYSGKEIFDLRKFAEIGTIRSIYMMCCAQFEREWADISDAFYTLQAGDHIRFKLPTIEHFEQNGVYTIDHCICSDTGCLIIVVDGITMSQSDKITDLFDIVQH